MADTGTRGSSEDEGATGLVAETVVEVSPAAEAHNDDLGQELQQNQEAHFRNGGSSFEWYGKVNDIIN